MGATIGRMAGALADACAASHDETVVTAAALAATRLNNARPPGTEETRRMSEPCSVVTNGTRRMPDAASAVMPPGNHQCAWIRSTGQVRFTDNAALSEA